MSMYVTFSCLPNSRWSSDGRCSTRIASIVDLPLVKLDYCQRQVFVCSGFSLLNCLDYMVGCRGYRLSMIFSNVWSFIIPWLNDDENRHKSIPKVQIGTCSFLYIHFGIFVKVINYSMHRWRLCHVCCIVHHPSVCQWPSGGKPQLLMMPSVVHERKQLDWIIGQSINDQIFMYSFAGDWLTSSDTLCYRVVPEWQQPGFINIRIRQPWQQQINITNNFFMTCWTLLSMVIEFNRS